MLNSFVSMNERILYTLKAERWIVEWCLLGIEAKDCDMEFTSFELVSLADTIYHLSLPLLIRICHSRTEEISDNSYYSCCLD